MKDTTPKPTRYYSNIQEAKVAKILGGNVVANSGAGRFKKGDVHIESASMLCECKTVTTPKKSVSVQKEWLTKLKEEAFSNRLSNIALAISFEPEVDNVYFVIDEKLMRYLVDCLSKDE